MNLSRLKYGLTTVVKHSLIGIGKQLL